MNELVNHAAFLRSLVAHRRDRGEFFEAALLGEPGWDILLDLALADATGRHLSISDVCLGSGAPATTALRYIDRIEASALAHRADDPTDRRRHFLELSKRGYQAMLAYLRSIDAVRR